MVIPCWDISIQQLVKGQEANLTCPSQTAYGAQGIRGVIPPNATLKFNVELVDFKKWLNFEKINLFITLLIF